MKKIVEYHVVVNSKIVDFKYQVNEFIKLGWQPIGGVAIETNSQGSYYYQAIVKYQEDQ